DFATSSRAWFSAVARTATPRRIAGSPKTEWGGIAIGVAPRHVVQCCRSSSHALLDRGFGSCAGCPRFGAAARFATPCEIPNLVRARGGRFLTIAWPLG